MEQQWNERAGTKRNMERGTWDRMYVPQSNCYASWLHVRENRKREKEGTLYERNALLMLERPRKLGKEKDKEEKGR